VPPRAINGSASGSYNDTLVITFDTLLTVSGTTPAAYSIIPGEVKFLIDSLPAFSNNTYTIQLLVPVNQSLIGTTQWGYANLIAGNDYQPFNNTDSAARLVTASYDPNSVTIVRITPTAAWVSISEYHQTFGFDEFVFHVFEDAIKIRATTTSGLGRANNVSHVVLFVDLMPCNAGVPIDKVNLLWANVLCDRLDLGQEAIDFRTAD
jgi:hypothetical protein